MKNIILGSLIAFALGLFMVSGANYFFSSIKEVKLKEVKYITLKNDVENAINIADKVVIQKKMSESNYLNAWKLNITVIGKTPYAMFQRAKDTRLLKLNEILEDYKLVKIEKFKVLFSLKNENIWVYMKRKKIITDNSPRKVIQKQGTITIRQFYAKRYLKKPEALAKTIQILPVIKDGIFKGFHIKSIIEGSFLYNYGLRKDDYIKKINGKKLTSLSDAIYSYQKLQNSKKFTLSVLRDNKIQDLKYEIIK